MNTKQIEKLGQHLVVTGDPIDGLFFYGPFETAGDATAFAEEEHEGENWWVAPLTHPIEVARESASTSILLEMLPLPRSNAELLDVLDDVSAVAQSMFAHHEMSMTPADRGPRRRIIELAREICGEQLRGPDKDLDEDEDGDDEDREPEGEDPDDARERLAEQAEMDHRNPHYE